MSELNYRNQHQVWGSTDWRTKLLRKPWSERRRWGHDRLWWVLDRPDFPHSQRTSEKGAGVWLLPWQQDCIQTSGICGPPVYACGMARLSAWQRGVLCDHRGQCSHSCRSRTWHKASQQTCSKGLIFTETNLIGIPEVVSPQPQQPGKTLIETSRTPQGTGTGPGVSTPAWGNLKKKNSGQGHATDLWQNMSE